MEQLLLHGVLNVTVYEESKHSGGRWLMLFWKLIDKLLEKIWYAKRTLTIQLDNAKVGKIRHLENTSFHIYCAHKASNVVFTIKREYHILSKKIGKAYLPVAELLSGKEVDRWLHLMDDKQEPLRDSRIHVKLCFLDVSQDNNWSKGIRSPDLAGVPYTVFSQKKDCRVTLYQEAHVSDKFDPKIPLDGDKFYEPNRCWEDVFKAICNAKHLICITGWSVHTKITMVRDPLRNKDDITLGELLKKKAEEGLKVLVLAWRDMTSLKMLNNGGVMKTHDVETRNYFKNTKVHCILCPRTPDNKQKIIERLAVRTMFSHHEKIVVVDSEMPDGRMDKRRIVSFIGGIDLCDGRYDTQSHSIFKTLDTAHHDDFHQPNFDGASIDKGGPREPWHDTHCKLEGPIAWDVLHNFEQRWRKRGHKGKLLELKKIKGTFMSPSTVMFPEDQEAWNVQLFRSIDGGAILDLPKSPRAAAEVGLVRGKDYMIERSIQDGYINAIRRAKSFIYIENQYFLGSSFAWSSNELVCDEVKALHLIPKELSLKIVSKIEAGERFSVYIVIPMWPEGIPESSAVQAILYWQKMTMEMMYKDISHAIQSKGLDANPKDYLAFFCLGNREIKKDGEYEPSVKLKDNSDYSRAQQSRRFMIYVHSKMMIVDDEYIIIGSANINQRSMDGARDTEIAMGAYQPHHLSTMKPARGQIHGHRLALWYEHMGSLNDTFLKPESIECIQNVNQIAEKNWDLYCSNDLDDDLPSHLLSYPIRITEDGEVTTLPGTEFFPDTEAPILGSKSKILPSIITS